jgi:hypothetical protein
VRSVTAVQVRASSGVVLFVIGGAALFAGGDLYGAAIALVAYQCIAEYYGFLKNMGKGKGKVSAHSLCLVRLLTQCVTSHTPLPEWHTAISAPAF